MIVTVAAELQRWSGAGIAPWSDHPERGLVHAWKRIDATNDFLVVIEQLLLCLSVEHGRGIDCEDVTRIHAGILPLQCKQCGHQHARADEENERCANLCDYEDALATFATSDLAAATGNVQCL